MNIEKIIGDLFSKKLNIYDAIVKIKKSPNKYKTQLRKLLVIHKHPYIRLFCAWSLGEIEDTESFDLLTKQYYIEKDDNVRTNIVRALFLIKPYKFSQKNLKTFFLERYYPIPIMALKFFIFNKNFHNKINFLSIYTKLNDSFEKIELLRHIKLFKFKRKKLLTLFKKELEEEKNILIKSELILAIANLNDPNSLSTLISYYDMYKKDFTNSIFLAYAFVSGVNFLCQTKAYNILYSLYINYNEILLRGR